MTSLSVHPTTALVKTLFRPYINSSRVHLERFVQRAASSVPRGSLILDAGAGESTPYRHLFRQHRYESADISGNVTYKCDISSLPVENDRFDLVVSTQLLEHVPNPQAVICELFRILKPSRQLWLTTPLFYEEHLQPYDFFRYTRFGLRRIFESAGFCVEEITELEGYCGTLAYQLEVASRSLPRRPASYGRGLPAFLGAALGTTLRPACAILARVYSHLDVQNKVIGAGQCKNYCVIAMKPVDRSLRGCATEVFNLSSGESNVAHTRPVSNVE